MTVVSPNSNPEQVLVALDAIANKRRTRPQLERARVLLAQLAAQRTRGNSQFFQDVTDALDEADNAMDYVEDADTAEEKTMWREEADSFWQSFADALEELAEALTPDE